MVQILLIATVTLLPTRNQHFADDQPDDHQLYGFRCTPYCSTHILRELLLNKDYYERRS